MHTAPFPVPRGPRTGKQACAPQRGAPSAGRPVAVGRPSAPTRGPGAGRPMAIGRPSAPTHGPGARRPVAVGRPSAPHAVQVLGAGAAQTDAAGSDLARDRPPAATPTSQPQHGAAAGGGAPAQTPALSRPDGGSDESQRAHVGPDERKSRPSGLQARTQARAASQGSRPGGPRPHPPPCPRPEGGQHHCPGPGGPVPASPGSQAACSCPFPASPPPV